MDAKDIRYQRDAAFIGLRPLLESKKRGDRITAAEIRDATGFDDWKGLRSRIRQYFEAKGLFLRAVPNDGYRIIAGNEHADESARHQRTALKREIKSLNVISSAPVEELSDDEVRRVRFQRDRSVRRVELAASHDQDNYHKLGIKPLRQRIPALRLKSGDEQEQS
jgi:hypothetical protein